MVLKGLKQSLDGAVCVAVLAMVIVEIIVLNADSAIHWMILTCGKVNGPDVVAKTSLFIIMATDVKLIWVNLMSYAALTA